MFSHRTTRIGINNHKTKQHKGKHKHKSKKHKGGSKKPIVICIIGFVGLTVTALAVGLNLMISAVNDTGKRETK